MFYNNYMFCITKNYINMYKIILKIINVILVQQKNVHCKSFTNLIFYQTEYTIFTLQKVVTK